MPSHPRPAPPAVAPSPGDLFLQAASSVVLELLTFEDLLQTIIDRVIEMTQSTKGFLILLGADGELEFKVARNMRREEIDNPKISRNLIRQCVESGASVISGHAGEDPRFQDMESVHNLLLKSILCVPLRNAERVFGVIYLENHITAGVFDAKRRGIVERIAEQASHALGLTRAVASLRGERDRLVQELIGSREYEFGRFVGRSEAMARVADQIARIAGSRHTVLVRGESGTGKDLVARMLHTLGPWRERPFVAVNCAAVPGSLFESELFGHVKGAFTGADRTRIGKVEAAQDGTLFLDEIGDLPLDVQPKLLRLLQERTYERVGENETHTADIRVIAATNKDLTACVRNGTFRDDLYHRLNTLPVTLPPLRQRSEDIPELAHYFLRRESRPIPGFTAEALAFLKKQPWPGNVRELRNVVVRAAVFTTNGELIDVDVLRAQQDQAESRQLERELAPRVELPIHLGHRDAMNRLEELYLRELIARRPNLSRAELAEQIGISRRTLFQRLKDLGITD